MFVFFVDRFQHCEENDPRTRINTKGLLLYFAGSVGGFVGDGDAAPAITGVPW